MLKSMADAKAQAEIELQGIGNAKSIEEINEAQNKAVAILSGCLNNLANAAAVVLPADATQAKKDALAEVQAESEDAKSVYAETIEFISSACVTERERVTAELASIESTMAEAERRTDENKTFAFPKANLNSRFNR